MILSAPRFLFFCFFLFGLSSDRSVSLSLSFFLSPGAEEEEEREKERETPPALEKKKVRLSAAALSLHSSVPFRGWALWDVPTKLGALASGGKRRRREDLLSLGEERDWPRRRGKKHYAFCLCTLLALLSPPPFKRKLCSLSNHDFPNFDHDIVALIVWVRGRSDRRPPRRRGRGVEIAFASEAFPFGFAFLGMFVALSPPSSSFSNLSSLTLPLSLSRTFPPFSQDREIGRVR